jgi:ankyrin repeat protein
VKIALNFFCSFALMFLSWPVYADDTSSDWWIIGSSFEGQGTQSSGSSWSIEIRVISDTEATISYPSIPCSGTLTLKRLNKDRAFFSEDIVENVKKCDSDGTVSIRRTQGGKFVFRWQKGDITARGTLEQSLPGKPLRDETQDLAADSEPRKLNPSNISDAVKFKLVTESFAALATVDDYRNAIAEGANVRTVTTVGDLSALHYAIRFGEPANVEFLIEQGADINAANKFLETPLHYAASTWGGQNLSEALSNTQSLIKAGANVDAASDQGVTPLMLSISVDVAQALLAAGADRTLRTNEGKDVAQHIAAYGNSEVAVYIKRAISSQQSTPSEDANTKVCNSPDVLEVRTEPNGCIACVGSSDANRYVWKGQCVDEMIDGDGILYWYSGEDLTWRFASNGFQRISRGNLIVDYNVDNIFDLNYFDDEGTRMDACSPYESNGDYRLPRIQVDVELGFPLHLNYHLKEVLAKVEKTVARACKVGMQSNTAGIDFDVEDIRQVNVEISVSNGSGVTDACGYGGTSIGEISDCYEDQNPWLGPFIETINAVNSRRDDELRRQAEQQRLAEETALQSEIEYLKAQAEQEHRMSLEKIADDIAMPIPNLADFAARDPGSLISLMASGRLIYFTPKYLDMRNGMIFVTAKQLPTPIYAEIEQQFAGKATGWDQWFADIDKAAGVGEYTVICIVDQSQAEAFGKQRLMSVIATLDSFQGRNIVLKCRQK